MKAIDVVEQLYSALPHYTDKFTDNFNVTSLAKSGTTVTAVLDAPHEFNVIETNYAFIDGAKNPVVISSMGQTKGVATAQTATAHDLTLSDEEKRLKLSVFIEINGATEIQYNGTHELLDVIDEFNFKFKIDSSAPTTATGSPLLLQDGRDYNGWHLVTSIPPTPTQTLNITSLTSSSGIAEAQTVNPHNYSTGMTITIAGADQSEYNGSFQITVTDIDKFQYAISGTPVSPATGTITSSASISFTYESNDPVNSPAVGTITARLRPRISRVVEENQAITAYTEQNLDKLWAFVVIGDRIANKSREVMSDATNTVGRGEEFRQLMIQPFSIFTIFPATQEIAAAKERDNADDLTLPFLKSLLRVKFPSGFEEDAYSGTIFSGDRFFLYNKAIYVHEYAFETTAWVVYGDTIEPEHSVAFNEIDLEFNWSIGDGEAMEGKVKLR